MEINSKAMNIIRFLLTTTAIPRFLLAIMLGIVSYIRKAHHPEPDYAVQDLFFI
jgi:hypothetical protein